MMDYYENILDIYMQHIEKDLSGIDGLQWDIIFMAIKVRVKGKYTC